MRNSATLDLRRCGVRDCAHAVVLERNTSTVHAERCSFTNVKEAFQTRGGGTVELEYNTLPLTLTPNPNPNPNPKPNQVELEYNTFMKNEVALKLDDKVSPDK